MELPKTYNAKEIEDEIYKKWETSGFFNPDNLEKAHDRFWNAEVFSMAMPPPNITAELHVGHAMFLALEDLMARYARMSGKKTLWLPGTDHAAIATQNVVERDLWEKEKKTRHDIGRTELLRRIEEFITRTRGRIQTQIRKMGSSCDWSREKYTFSPELSMAVRTVFKKMYDAGLIYQGRRIVNWCPRCATTLADDEVEYREEAGKLYYLKYPFPEGKDALVVATARPETMLGDTAAAINPKDERYKKFLGKKVMLPLLNRELLIIPDPAIDMKFGTGAMKITPGHDAHDFEIGEQHNLPIINVFTLEGKVSSSEALDNGFENYANLTISEARDKIVADLASGGFLVKTEDFQHSVGYCYRCSRVVEPLISKQWFVGVNSKFKIQNSKFWKGIKLKGEETTLSEMAAATVKSGAIKIVPERFAKIYLNWMDNLHDWNISRQIWFGHRVPVWYCGENASAETNVKMGFHESVVSQLYEGKTKTYRLRDHNFTVGQKVTFENSGNREVLGTGMILAIGKTTIEKIDLQDPAHGAVYDKLEDLMARFRLLNPAKKISKSTPVFIYTYEFTPLTKTNGSCGQMIVSIDPPKSCPSCGNTNLTQDPDTLDTWFSSSLWTFSTLGWPESTPDLQIYHPTTILETGYDILFFWVARMILMTGFVLEDVPFHTVYLNGLVRDKAGRKMSKSLKNVLNPLDVIDQYGTDALRLSLLIGTTPGNDLKIYPEKIETFRNFANKLWNISRFVLEQTGKSKIQISNSKPEAKTLTDQWILEELDILIESVNKNLSAYQYNLAGEALIDFTWNKFADWYLEISKVTLQRHPRESGNPSPTEAILIHILKTLLKLWHPLIPFVTEFIWSQFNESLLMLEPYPTENAKPKTKSSKIHEQFKIFQDLIIRLRNLRAEYREAPGKTLAAYLDLPASEEWLNAQVTVIEKLARVKLNLEKVPQDKQMPYFLWNNTKVYLIIPDFDAKKELKIAQKNLAQTEKWHEKLEKQLQNKKFLQKAPAEIVEKMKTDFAAAEEQQKKLHDKIYTLK